MRAAASPPQPGGYKSRGFSGGRLQSSHSHGAFHCHPHGEHTGVDTRSSSFSSNTQYTIPYCQVLLFIPASFTAPQRFKFQQRTFKRSAEEGGDHNEHLFHGSHLWGLEDFHEDANGDSRKRRSPDEESGGNHNEHLFHGSHLWGLEDFHEDANGDSRKRRSPEEESEGNHNEHLFHGSHLWGLDDFHEPTKGI